MYYMRKNHNLYIGEAAAEQIKIEAGVATEVPEDTPGDMMV